MNNAIFTFEYPDNEPVKSYSPGSKERKELQAEWDNLSNQQIDIPLIIGGKEVRTGNTEKICMPYDYGYVLGNYNKVGVKDVI